MNWEKSNVLRKKDRREKGPKYVLTMARYACECHLVNTQFVGRPICIFSITNCDDLLKMISLFIVVKISWELTLVGCNITRKNTKLITVKYFESRCIIQGLGLAATEH